MNDSLQRRDSWTSTLVRIGRPVLTHLANRTLRQEMPVEVAPGQDRRTVARLEAFGRLLAGMAPWLGSNDPLAAEWIGLAREGLDAISDPQSPDYAEYSQNTQALVDTAFLAQGLLRATDVLWTPLEPRVKRNLVAALKSSRQILPCFNNWLLFSATVEAALFVLGESDWDPMRVDYALRQHKQWYKGDGLYGDGPDYHADYYNSFVIQPMLLDILDAVRPFEKWRSMEEVVERRAIRYAAILERMISPEGTFPPTGRSLAYRIGALQSLAQAAWRGVLPEGVAPAQVRCAMTAVMRRMFEAPGTFDERGWLRIGFCGAQPEIGEGYISTGSLYLCAVGFLPLGLPATAEFWSAPDAKWTAAKAWGGESFPIDHAVT